MFSALIFLTDREYLITGLTLGRERSQFLPKVPLFTLSWKVIFDETLSNAFIILAAVGVGEKGQKKRIQNFKKSRKSLLTKKITELNGGQGITAI